MEVYDVYLQSVGGLRFIKVTLFKRERGGYLGIYRGDRSRIALYIFHKAEKNLFSKEINETLLKEIPKNFPEIFI